MRYDSEPILDELLEVPADDEEEVEPERDLAVQSRLRPLRLEIQRFERVSVGGGLRRHAPANFCIRGRTHPIEDRRDEDDGLELMNSSAGESEKGVSNM